jgi:hypothetical protein
MTPANSVMFSLQELERMEAERVRALADAAERERALSRHRQREAEERVRAEHEAREHAETERRRAVEQRAREEAARIEAIHRAAVEAARVEAEAKARSDAREIERRHELELERERVASSGTPGRASAAMTLFGGVVAGGIAMAAHFGVVAPREHARATEADAAIASREVAIADLRRQGESTDARLRSLEGDLQTIRAENDELRRELQAASRTTGPRNAPPRRTGAPSRAEPPALNGFTTCAPGSKDPMCVR